MKNNDEQRDGMWKCGDLWVPYLNCQVKDERHDDFSNDEEGIFIVRKVNIVKRFPWVNHEVEVARSEMLAYIAARKDAEELLVTSITYEANGK